ncbi:hypothetical protein GOP47_0016163 [Adiantum capillus-veneris]|uniref:Uncharacterized protein n=1 Tax=Adiantum capillus-veneris TaxID=13818 RepID=A0A9D4ZDA3_ADICA|nr:hypothetical protein GOP47_0016163 [Adiantum capillus-veneris]
MSSLSNLEKGAVCAVNPFAGGLQFQSSQPHLKRFIMFDHSNGKGRVFFHPAVAQDMFGSVQSRILDSKVLIPNQEVKSECSASSFAEYKQMVEGAFISLQSLRASRPNDVFLPKADALTSGEIVSSQKPRVPETAAKVVGKSWTLDAQDVPGPHVASETLVCEEKSKVAIRPSIDSKQDCLHNTSLWCSPPSNRSDISGLKRTEVAAESELMQENTEDLDALLSSDEDEDDDVRSTGHSPDESLGKEAGEEEAEEEAEQNPCKRRRMFDEYEGELGLNKKANCGNECDNAQSSRRLKIKKTVKALRRMIPGGGLLDTAFVLDRTIMYVKTLRDRVNQLEVTRHQPQLCDPHNS